MCIIIIIIIILLWSGVCELSVNQLVVISRGYESVPPPPLSSVTH